MDGNRAEPLVYAPSEFCRLLHRPGAVPFGDRKAYRDHIRNDGVRMCKFDCFSAVCNNPAHNHLPCVYSTEAMHNAVLELLRALDDENHEVFLMLYWGYRSPWWLLDADTIFEPGLFLEGAHPGGTPTLYVRDSVTQGLDQAHYYCQDIPWLGKDSLGIWLSDWWWNSSIGKARWQEGFRDGHGPRQSLAADLGRLGLAFAARVAADGHAFQARESTTPLLRQQPLHPRQSLEKRALRLLLHRRPPGVLLSEQLHVERPRAPPATQFCLGTAGWSRVGICTAGIRSRRIWPPELRLWQKQVDLAMRPFEVVLLEAVPKGEKPALDRPFADQPLPTSFSESSRRVEVNVLPSHRPTANHPAIFHVQGKIPPTAAGGVLVVTVELHQGSHAWAPRNTGSNFTAEASVAGGSVSVQPVLGNLTYEVPWQAWRIPIAPAGEPRDFELSIRSRLPPDVSREFSAYFLPE